MQAESSRISNPIVILGSGIGGLTLGRCLRQKGIPYTLYERSSHAQRHAYGITLHSWAYKPLLKVLGIDEQMFRRRVAVDSLYHGGIGKVHPGHTPPSEPSDITSFRAHRSKLERLLGEGQEVKREHMLSDAEVNTKANGVKLSFQNERITSSYVVDALGVHSQLRKSLLPDCSLKVLPFVVFSGKRYISGDLFRDLYEPHLRDGNILELKPARDGGALLQIWVDDHESDGRVSISYTYSRPEIANGHDPLHNPDRPIPGATDIPDEFYEELEQMIEDRKPPEPFLTTFDSEKIQGERLLHWLMRTVLVPQNDLNKLIDSGVVLLGDSAHAMQILGGQGANYAMQDSLRLADIIAEHANSKQTPDKAAVRQFYEQSWPQWKEGVAASEKAIVEMHAMQKAVL